jgi:DNA invertase Pin-like site-specific DNA recombinase
MTISRAKVLAEHLERWAYVYVRQSDPAQVLDHQESTRRQYELQNRARQLGWPDERIVVIDEDLGRSASDASQRRSGFERLLADVVVERAGAILSVEVSRLARQDSEGHRLVEVAALTGTLLIDERTVYDPRLPDDRLMLGIKVLLSSNEVRQMGQRLWENKLRKAQRGELRINLPVGLVFVPQQGVCMEPDERVQAAVHLLFERFRLSHKISHVVRYFHDHGLQFPKRKGGWHGPLEWGPLSCQRVRAVLCNPLYAGAYVYGRVTHRAVAKPAGKLHQPVVRLPAQDWAVTIWDDFPGYISRAEYEANQAILAQNRRKSPGGPGRRQDGAALLTCIVLCGRCGQRMQVVYSGKDSQCITYICCHRQRRYAEPVCQRIPGQALDPAIAQAVLAALTPAQIELSLAVMQELERQQAELRKQWELKLEGARYAARLAQRRYEQVDPENRLVARSLEQQWEAKLREVDRLQTEFVRQQRQLILTLNPAQRQQLADLVRDLPRVWHAETTSWTERKDLLQLLVADVTLTRQETDILAQIRWHTNELDTFSIPLPKRGAPPVPMAVVERVRRLSKTHTDRQIAAELTQDGIQTPQGKPFTAQRVQGIRRRCGIRKRSSNSDQRYGFKGAL